MPWWLVQLLGAVDLDPGTLLASWRKAITFGHIPVLDTNLDAARILGTLIREAIGGSQSLNLTVLHADLLQYTEI